MNLKELTLTFMMILNSKHHLISIFYTKLFQRFKGLQMICVRARVHETSLFLHGHDMDTEIHLTHEYVETDGTSNVCDFLRTRTRRITCILMA